MGFLRRVSLGVVVLGATLALFEMTDLDLWVQDHLFHFETGLWLVDRNAVVPRLLFYTGIKGVIIAFGVTLLVRYGLSFRTKSGVAQGLPGDRQRWLTVILSLVVVPLTIATMKDVTNIYCPSQIVRYGGDKPYVKPFEPYPEVCSRCDSGRCFPAGHASGGFALMALARLYGDRRRKMAGLGAGVALGWVMGGYQMMKGAHFLSHTVVTMVIAWILIECVAGVAQRVHPDPGHRARGRRGVPLAGGCCGEEDGASLT
ncbi:phosphatase PAP2 family protein [Desulfoluna butyratoxydans]|uniref:Phosphatidic acid phosphatase type 2/haloperoxidase n=1 Tax=Desulfoluna butyratoxydans TaxID=231438 RepID=A0A4U8YMR0_9BACT|nr:phosphatase PAP2 family protein [Desulfoluna butyratoxydans]VFQ42503.1 phosphatidic acid phosphatase type 2/haloperoxidase [Desulfoluna butyratoxydans]